MKKGRIAVPSIDEGGLNGQRSGHFGHCDVFTLVDVWKEERLNRLLPSPIRAMFKADAWSL